MLVLASLALASPPMELVPRNGSAKRMTTTVSTKGAPISTKEFADVVLDCAKYPLTASYMGVKALLECKTLEKRGDGYTIVYQRTGGNALVSSRQYVLALRATELTDTKARVEWDLVKHTGEPGSFTGPYAAALNAHADAVYTPSNTGGWVYDRTAGTITYYVQSDPGGTVPGWLVSQDAVMAFPLELLEVRWGVQP
ncbi:MAG: hypothetical protein ACOZNI_12815 [Myxococcota bacterium]